MRQIVNDLRKQPAHDRHKMSMFLALAFSAIVFLVWAGTFRLSPTTTVDSVKKGLAPFTLVKDNIVQVFSTAQKGLESAQQPITKTNDNSADQ